MDWKSEGKRLRDTPRNRWLDVVEQNFKALHGVQNLREVFQYKGIWKNVVMAAKTLNKIIKSREEEKNSISY